MKLLRSLIFTAIAALACAPALRAASPGPWQARVRGTYLSMAQRSDAFTALGINFPADAVNVNSKYIPEFDFSYNFTENVATELVLTVPQTQEVTLAGVGKLGTFRHLPPVLSVQYHFAPGQTFNPYLGVGVNFTLIYSTNLKVANVPLDLGNNSFGVAAEAGADFNLGNGFYLNLDVKKVTLSTNVSVHDGAKLTHASLDPWLISLGLGMRF